jgi:hypothetical protein
MPTGASDPRLKTAARRRLRALKARGRPPCWICGGDIDYDAPRNHPDSYELDEVVPRAYGGNPLDPSQTAPAHARCNRRGGATITNRTLGRTPRLVPVEADEW